MRQSQYYGFKLPEGSDIVDINVISDNFEAIDGLIQASPTGTEPIGSIQTTVRTDLGENWLLCDGSAVPVDRKQLLAQMGNLSLAGHWTELEFKSNLSGGNKYFAIDNSVFTVWLDSDAKLYLLRLDFDHVERVDCGLTISPDAVSSWAYCMGILYIGVSTGDNSLSVYERQFSGDGFLGNWSSRNVTGLLDNAHGSTIAKIGSCADLLYISAAAEASDQDNGGFTTLKFQGGLDGTRSALYAVNSAGYRLDDFWTDEHQGLVSVSFYNMENESWYSRVVKDGKSISNTVVSKEGPATFRRWKNYMYFMYLQNGVPLQKAFQGASLALAKAIDRFPGYFFTKDGVDYMIQDDILYKLSSTTTLPYYLATEVGRVSGGVTGECMELFSDHFVSGSHIRTINLPDISLGPDTKTYINAGPPEAPQYAGTATIAISGTDRTGSPWSRSATLQFVSTPDGYVAKGEITSEPYALSTDQCVVSGLTVPDASSMTHITLTSGSQILEAERDASGQYAFLLAATNFFELGGRTTAFTARLFQSSSSVEPS